MIYVWKRVNLQLARNIASCAKFGGKGDINKATTFTFVFIIIMSQ